VELAAVETCFKTTGCALALRLFQPPFAGSELSLISEINLQTYLFESQEGFLGDINEIEHIFNDFKTKTYLKLALDMKKGFGARRR
jgi:hypothetical protein